MNRLSSSLVNRFEACLDSVLRFEGGYSNHPADKGGATKYGITQAVLGDWLKLKGRPMAQVREITAADVQAIYRERYWDECRGDDLPAPVDLLVFDAAVQHGVKRAVRWLQRCAEVTVDGLCGDQTIDAVQQFARGRRLDELIYPYLAARTAFYAQIIASDPAQKVFAAGWKNRMDALARQVCDGQH